MQCECKSSFRASKLSDQEVAAAVDAVLLLLGELEATRQDPGSAVSNIPQLSDTN